jgi:hypothetical protein
LNARKATLAVAALLAVALASCGTARRAGKDLFIGVLSAPLILYGASTDGYESSVGVREGLDSGSAMQVLSFPFTFLYHAFEHTLYWSIHVIDLPLCVFYGLSELPPDSEPVRPLDFYQGTWFDKEEDRRPSGTDATSGESLPPGYKR